MAHDLANSYGQYLKIDLGEKLKAPHVAVEELLTRLDEFENLLMLTENKKNPSICVTIPNIETVKPMFEKLCDRIDRLDELVAHVEASVTALEKAVDTAETDLTAESNSGFRKYLWPLFQRQPTHVLSGSNNRDIQLEIPSIFNADGFFNSSVNIEELSSKAVE